jgi:signal transduction histidine kinase/CheY-like chemotaxis protein
MMNKMIQVDDIEDWERQFYVVYNDSYKLYLNNIHPTITKSSSGYIVSVHKSSEGKIINVEALYNKNKSNDDTMIIKNSTLHIDSKSVCMRAINTENIQLSNKLSQSDFIDEPIKFPYNYKSYICIPYKYNDVVTGVLALTSFGNYEDKCFSMFKILGNMIASLQNNYFALKISNPICTENRIVIYQLMDDILNTTQDGIILVDTNYDFIYTNTCAETLLTELYGDLIKDSHKKNLLILFPQMNDFSGSIDKKIYKNRKFDIQINDSNPSSQKSLDFILNTVISAGKFYHLVTVHISTQKTTIENSEKQIMAYLSHELRNPLQSVNLATTLLKGKLKNEKNDKIHNYINTIEKSCSHMNKIINDVLDLSRLNSNEMVIDLDVYNVHEIISDAINGLESDVSSKKIKILTQYGDGIPKSIYTDYTRIIQILSNLLSNAIKYSDKNDIVIKVEYLDNNILFHIVDEGMGIKSDEFHKLFKTYGQTSNSFNCKVDSQGLGLCVSQKMAKLLGGQISVKSKVNKGSTFTLTHPIGLALSNDNINICSIADKMSGCILLVDDNESNLSLLHMLLDQFNYEFMWTNKIESVNNGMDAIELCKIKQYDIIFMDINMNGIDGCTASKIIKKNGFMGKIVATTGNILAMKENKGVSGNTVFDCFNQVIIKPFDDKTVLKTLKQFLVKDK